MKNILSLFGLMFLLTFSMCSTSQSGECDELKKENEKLRQELFLAKNKRQGMKLIFKDKLQ
jgi:hypothetical protein